MDIDVTALADVPTREVLVAILFTKDPNIDREQFQNVLEVSFGLVYNNLVHIADSRELDIALNDCLDGCVLGIWAVDRRIELKPTDEVVAVILAFTEHHDVPRVKKIPGTARKPYSFHIMPPMIIFAAPYTSLAYARSDQPVRTFLPLREDVLFSRANGLVD